MGSHSRRGPICEEINTRKRAKARLRAQLEERVKAEDKARRSEAPNGEVRRLDKEAAGLRKMGSSPSTLTAALADIGRQRAALVEQAIVGRTT